MEKPRGWASLTRLHRSDATAAPVAPDPFPSLGAPAPPPAATRNGVSLHAPFVSVVSKGLLDASPRRHAAEAVGVRPEDVVVARLRGQHGWAADVLVRDVLRAVDGDEALAGAQLDAMAGPQSPGGGGDGDGERGGVAGDESRAAGPAECERNDVYMKFRRDALRLSRARGKHARGAYNAYMAGDHTHAKQFSREARENFKDAEKLHAQAAEEILYSRNADGHANVWSIDLHGLHATEAVLALQERLAYIEKELTRNPAFLYSQSQRALEHEQPLPLAASRAVVKNELSVITGVGRHSKGGPSLPLAVKNFLLADGSIVYREKHLQGGDALKSIMRRKEEEDLPCFMPGAFEVMAPEAEMRALFTQRMLERFITRCTISSNRFTQVQLTRLCVHRECYQYVSGAGSSVS